MTNTDALTGKLLDIINQVQGAVSAHGADAVNLVLTSERISGLAWLITMFAICVISSLATWAFTATDEKEETHGATIFMGIVAVASFIFFINPWGWVQVFDPKLYIAHEIIAKFLS